MEVSGFILQLKNCECIHYGFKIWLENLMSSLQLPILKEGYLFHNLIITDLNSFCKLGN